MDAYQLIRNAILEGDFAPGRRLTEEFLASELEMSRTPIREALKRLETERLVTSLKRGVSVRSYSTRDITQIYDLRALLEGYAAGQAAMYRTEADLDLIREMQTLYSGAIDRTIGDRPANVKPIVHCNNRFHESVISASHNDHIQHLISGGVVVPLVFRSFYWYDKKEIVLSLDDHQTIMQAIKDRDAPRAKTAMMEHVFKGRDHVLRHLGAREPRDAGKEENEHDIDLRSGPPGWSAK